jgi:hypothetical protein
MSWRNAGPSPDGRPQVLRVNLVGADSGHHRIERPARDREPRRFAPEIVRARLAVDPLLEHQAGAPLGDPQEPLRVDCIECGRHRGGVGHDVRGERLRGVRQCCFPPGGPWARSANVALDRCGAIIVALPG